MRSFIQTSNELIRKRGYRLTPQRHMILRVIEESHQHLSIDQIIQRLEVINPYVSLSTVYRTLDLLKSLNLIRESHLPNGQAYYEAATGGHAHHHLVCRQCQITIHLDETLLGNLHERLQSQYKFYGLTLDLMAAGYCASCWNIIQEQLQHTHQDEGQENNSSDPNIVSE